MKTLNIQKLDVILFFVMIAFFASFLFVIRPVRTATHSAQSGTLISFISDDTYWSQIDDFCVKDGYIYLLFSDKGVIKIYDENGSYIRSYAYYKTKGQSRLFADEEKVCFFDEQHNCYTFSAGEFECCKELDYHSYYDMVKALAANEDGRKSAEGEYFLKYASVYREQNDGTVTRLIVRPFAAAVYREHTFFIIYASLLLSVFICILIFKSKRHADHENI